MNNNNNNNIGYMKMEETVALIKSCIISKKGGVPIEDLNGEYSHSSNFLFEIFVFIYRMKSKIGFNIRIDIRNESYIKLSIFIILYICISSFT